MHRIALALVLALPSLAVAQTSLVKVQRYHTNGAKCPDTTAPAGCKVQSAALLDTSAAFTMDVVGYSKLTIQLDHTHAAASAITLTCEGSLNGGSTYARITATSILAGTGTVTVYTDSYTTGGASSNILLEYGVQGYDKVRCDIGDTAATSDTITVYASASVGS